MTVFVCSFFAFGAGRRVCVGEVMSKNRLFLLFTRILQKFTIQADSIPPISDPRKFQPGFVMLPQRYKVKFIPRN